MMAEYVRNMVEPAFVHETPGPGQSNTPESRGTRGVCDCEIGLL